MKMKKICRRIVVIVAACAMLLSGITAFAEAPAKNDGSNLTWKDVWDLQTFMEDNYHSRVGSDELWLLGEDEDVDEQKTHAPEGKLLLSYEFWNSFEELDKIFAEAQPPENAEDSTEITDNELKNKYSDWYDAATTAVDEIVTATGEYYVDESLWEENASLWTYIDPVWELDKADKIIIVDTAAGDTPPDETKMESGTYWIYESDWDAFCTMCETIDALCESYFGTEDNPKDMTAAQVSEVNDKLREAGTFIWSKLHGKACEPEPKPEPAPAKETKKSSSRRTETQQQQEETPVLINQVVGSDGAKSVSSIEGVYGKNCAAGIIYKDQSNKIKQSAGLTEEEIGKGVLVKYYICESRNKEMNKKLADSTAEKGYKLLGVINNDLYKMNKGSITPVRKTSEALTIVLGLPEKLRNDKYEIAVLCFDENGNSVEMTDMDEDKATVTVQANHFGYWAIAYREKANS